jgi:hypothetical protein
MKTGDASKNWSVSINLTYAGKILVLGTSLKVVEAVPLVQFPVFTLVHNQCFHSAYHADHERINK